jgi:hypothetical protein
MSLEDRLNAHMNVEKERIDELTKQRNEVKYKLTQEGPNVDSCIAVCTGLAFANAAEILNLKLDCLEILKQVLLIRDEIGIGAPPKLGLSYNNSLTVSNNTADRLRDIEDKLDNISKRIS